MSTIGLSTHPEWPADTHPKWPAERGFETYNFMSGGVIKSMIEEKLVGDSDTVIDVGPGKYCFALLEIARRVHGVRLIGIAPHPPLSTPPPYISYIPKSLSEIPNQFQNVSLITDIFSSVTYGEKIEKGKYVPAGHEALIQLAGWLKPKGMLVACTEVMRLGDCDDRKQISSFFQQYMGLECEFSIYRKFAEANRVIEDQLRIVVQNLKTFEDLSERGTGLITGQPSSTSEVDVSHPLSHKVLGIKPKKFLNSNDSLIHIGDAPKVVSREKWLYSCPIRTDSTNQKVIDLHEFPKAKVITDVFAFTHCPNNDPLDSLIQLALHLAPKGRLIVCTDFDRFGVPEDNWPKLVHFFRTSMGLECRFETLTVNSHENRLFLRVVIEQKQAFKDLLAFAESFIGTASRGRVLWESKDKNPEERMRIYQTVFSRSKTGKV